MNLVEKLYTVIILSAAVIGTGLGRIEEIQANTEHFIVPLLMLMLYLTFLQIPLQQAKQAFGNTRFASACSPKTQCSVNPENEKVHIFYFTFIFLLLFCFRAK
ncbi:hypothetical protein ACRC6Q_01270 [Planococcus sp. SE5232]|uniref:hypothetical protein n=1 Tax=unclassified Planococcus (in: firmicutes) TaxID=2662419 RepID=UPI003D6B0109